MFFVLRDVSSFELPPDFDLCRIRTLNRTLELGSLSKQGSLKVLSVQIAILGDDVWKRIELTFKSLIFAVEEITWK